jgi:hypothetical protein
METKQENEIRYQFWNVENENVVCIVRSDGTARYVKLSEVLERCNLYKSKREAAPSQPRSPEGV